MLEDEVETIKNQNLRIKREGFKVSATSLPDQQLYPLRREDDLHNSRSTVYSSDVTDEAGGGTLSRDGSVSEADGGDNRFMG